MKLNRTLKTERDELVEIISHNAELRAYEEVKHIAERLFMFNDKAKEEVIKVEKLKVYPLFFKEEVIKQVSLNKSSFELKDNVDFVFEVKFFGWWEDITKVFDQYCSVK